LLAEMVDEVIEFDFFHARSDQGAQKVTQAELEALRQRLAPYRFDLAVDLRRHAETRQFLQYTGARLLAGCDTQGNFPWLDIAVEWGGDAARARKRGHAADELVNLADAICAACEPLRSVIVPPSDDTLPVSEPLRRWLLSRRVVCVHPAAGGTLKQWPPEYFAKLIDMLVEREQVNVVLIGSPDEKAIASRVMQSVRNRWAVLDLIGEPVNKLAQLHHLLVRCALFVGNDSGPKHLAAGLGVPTVGIHSGQVDAREWGPAGPHAVALRREMECSPCYLTNPADCHRRAACMTGIMPGEVYTACKRLLALRPVSPVREACDSSQSFGADGETKPRFRIDAKPLNAISPWQGHPGSASPLPAANRFEFFDARWYRKSNPDVATSGIDPFEHYLNYGRKEERKPNATPGPWVPVTAADIRCFKRPSFRNEMALFVTHSPNGHLKPHVHHYLESLESQGIAVVLIVAADAPFLGADRKLMDTTGGIYIRRNQGYDFAAWAHVLRLHPDFFAATILYLINDSVFGPTSNQLFAEILERVRRSSADLVGLTENHKKGWHIQSYFLALRARVLSSAVFQQFFRDVVAYRHKEDVINEYEVKLASILTAAGFECEAIFQAIDSKDMTTHHWQHLLRSGFPFIKMGVVRDMIVGVGHQ
jgi:ADP-heptose:LPS heptosyltransferase